MNKQGELLRSGRKRFSGGRLLSMFLALCMIVTMLPVSAMAEEIHTTIGGSGEIISFAPLKETAEAVSLQTSIEDLELPETLTATVRTAVPPAKEPVLDSGNPDEDVTSGDLAIATTSSAIEAEIDEPEDTGEPQWEETTVEIPATWECADYDPNTEGVYVFRAVIEGYAVRAPLPEMTVTVGAARSYLFSAVPDVAQIGEQGYTTLQAAVDAVADGQTIKLLNSTLESITIAAGSDNSFTLDLNGKTLNGGNDAAISNNGECTLTITDSSSGGKVTAYLASIYAIHNAGSGTVIVSDGMVSTSGFGTYAICNAGSVTVSGGMVSTSGDGGTAIFNYGSGTVTVSGGTVSASGTGGFAIFNYGSSTVIVSGGTIESIKSTAIINSGSGIVTILNGTSTIRGFYQGMIEAPQLSDYANVKIRASTTDAQGGDATVITKEELASGILTYKYLRFEPAPALIGTAVISNTAPRIGDTLTGSLVSSNNTGTLTYVWKADGTQLGTGASYTVTSADLGKAIALNITSSVEMGTVSSLLTTAVAKKAPPTPPEAPTLMSKTHNSVTLASNTAYDFSKDGSVWQSSNVFGGLTAGTAYTFYQRVAETADTEHSAVSAGFSVTTDAATHTITYDSNGGTGTMTSGTATAGGGSNTPNAPAVTTPEKKPNQPITAETPVTAAAGTNGTARAEISDKSVTDAIIKAQADAKAQGKTANGIAVELIITMPEGATSLTAELTRDSLNSLVNAGAANLEIKGAPVTVSFDQKALAEIQKQSSGTINVAIAPRTSLTAEAKQMIGTRPVYDITVGYGGGKTVSSFGNGIATVFIPYTLTRGEVAGGLFAVYVDANGNAQRIAGSAYDSNTGCVLFTTPHLSMYGVGYTHPSAKFTDISSHWDKEAIDYVIGRDLLSGTTENTFEPDAAMTRGMLVTALGRLENVDVKACTTNSFTDVKEDSAFRPYIEWAYNKGIMQGTENGKFDPDCAITREEIAVIFANYAKATGYTLPVTRIAVTYADASGIGSTCQTAVTAMQQAGIMMGGTNNQFNPKSSATRGSVSTMLHRYIKLTIDPDTAHGWAKNDGGQYLYYKEGKAFTDTQTIDGVKYFFNTDGTLKTGWVKDNDGNWYYFNADGSLARSTKVDGYEIGANGVRKEK